MRFFTVSQSDLDSLGKPKEYDRVRINAHKDRSDRLHEMFIRHDRDSRHRPEKHLGKAESLLMLDGRARLVFVDDSGVINDFRDLGPYGSDAETFYCRTPADMGHQLIPCTQDPEICTKETTGGPWFREDSVAVEIKDLPEDQCGVRQRKPLGLVRVSEEAFYTTDRIVSVGRREIEALKAEVPNTARKRIRLCTHRNAQEKLHEMFVVYTAKTLIQPNKHLGKDESFHILEGSADFIFYTDSGDVLEIIPLGDQASGKTFFLRVPAGIYHTVVMTSDILVIHEATPGPYDRLHTVWAPWESNYLKQQTARATV